MADPSKTPFLRRMTRGGRPPPKFGEVSPAKALRLALAKAGQEVLDQIVTGGEVTESKAPLPEIAGSVPEGGLYVMLSGPGGVQGMVALDRALVAGITEALAIGQVTKGAPPDRNPTSTDGFLCQRFLVMVMTIFAAKLVGHPASDWATGFVPEDRVEDLRRLPFLMDDVPYRVMSVETDMGLGAKVGTMAVVLPWEGKSTRLALPDPAEVGNTARQWESDLKKAVLPTEAKLEAVLYTIDLPLSKVLALQPGALIPIPRRAVAEVELRSQTDEIVGHARLGQSQGFRAVRMEKAVLRADLSPGEDLTGHGAAPSAPDAIAALSMAPGLGSMVDDGGMDESGEMEFPAMDMDMGMEDGQDLPELPELPDLPDLDGGDDAEGEGDLPQIDIGSLPMDDLDDLPMTID